MHEPESPLSADLLRQMYQLRHRIFNESLRWDVVSSNGMERDTYDAMNPIYCLCQDDKGRVVGCWRLMQTVAPYLLKDVFPNLLGGHAPPSSPSVWEGSRFAYCADNDPNLSFNGVQEATSRLIAALLETGLRYGLERIVAVSEVRFERVLKRSGLITHRFAPSVRLGNSKAVAGWFEVTEENLRRVRKIGHLQGNILPLRRREHWAA